MINKDDLIDTFPEIERYIKDGSIIDENIYALIGHVWGITTNDPPNNIDYIKLILDNDIKSYDFMSYPSKDYGYEVAWGLMLQEFDINTFLFPTTDHVAYSESIRGYRLICAPWKRKSDTEMEVIELERNLTVSAGDDWE